MRAAHLHGGHVCRCEGTCELHCGYVCGCEGTCEQHSHDEIIVLFRLPNCLISGVPNCLISVAHSRFCFEIRQISAFLQNKTISAFPRNKTF